MKKKKSILRRLIPWLITLAALAALVVFVGIPLYSDTEEEVVNPPVISYYEGDKKPLTMENDDLLFELDPTNTHFTLTEKATGRQWLSNPANAAQDPVAVAANKALLQSTLVVTYSSSSGTIDFNNYQYSIENGTYSVDQAEDGTVSVTYSVGKIEKIYILPSAITVERYKAFTDAMSKKDAKKVAGVYTLYKPDKVAAMEDKDSLLSMYPSLAEQELYVLKSGTSENNKKSIASILEASGYTMEDYELDMQLVAGAAENTDAVFNVTVEYSLEGKDLLVRVPYEKIRYRAAFPITYVTLLPMFGAAGTDEKGYMFIPEGGGALIAFNNGKLSQNSYYANMYGWDYGSERTEVVSETKNTFPVFGMIKDGASFLCMMEGAPSYGGVQADISLRYNSYNWICAKYNVLHSDRYNVSAKTARLVYMFEKELPQDTIVQRYRFLDTDSYVDLAQAYGDYLRQRYPELTARTAGEELPVSVELVGAIDKKVVKFGLPVNAVIPTTTFQQAKDIIGDLQSSGVQNMSVRMTGWSNGGVDQKVLTRVKPIGSLGGAKGMQSLIQSAKSGGVPLYFDGVTCFAYNSGLLNGFIPFRDAARFTTREQIRIYPYSPIFYQQDEFFEPFYLVRPAFAQRMANNLMEALDKADAHGVAFRDIGYLLSGDYDQKDTTTREQVKQMHVDTLRAAHEKGQAVMIKEGYDYAMPYADLITEMDLNGIEYSIIDQVVPFYKIAIHGAVEYTGMSINLSDDWQTELLRCAEYGAGLNFTFMAEDGKILQDTLHSDLYGAGYEAWRGNAAALINEYQQAMRGLGNQRITGHEALSEDVRVTEYENGARVYVNYGAQDYQAEGVTVPARSYQVTRGDQ